MEDGLYQITTAKFCAGFVVEDGRITRCAPILRQRIHYWIQFAHPVRNAASEREHMALIPLPQGMPCFDARQVEPAKLMEALPAGWYNVKIVKSETKPTQKMGANNQPQAYLEFEFEVIDGEFSGRKVWERLNVLNDNELAVRIAYQQLAKLCEATGVVQVTDTTVLHGIPVRAKLKVVPARIVGDKNYDASNEIAQGGFEPLQSTVTAAPPAWVPPVATVPVPAAAVPGWTPPAATAAPWEAKAATPVPVAAAPVVVPPPAAPTPSPFPPEAIAWAVANPTNPQAVEILKTLPTPTPVQPWAAKPAAPNGPAKAPWAK